MSDLPAPETTPTDVGQGAEPPAAPEPQPQAEAPATDPGVQPPSDAGAQPDGGQGFIAPYLEGVEEGVRDTVADVLERFRQDQDAQVTKKFEQLNAYQQYAQDPAELETPVALYENLLSKPLDTVQWIFDQFSEAGIDLRAQLLEQATGQPQSQDPQAQPQSTQGDEDRPLTMAEFQRLQQEQQEQARQQQEAAARRETVKGWLDEAAQSKGLELGDEDVAVKQAIMTHAAQLMPQLAKYGEQAGKHAIDTAVEAFVNRFGKNASSSTTDPSQEPRVADGGTPPAPQKPDLTDPKARREWMLQRIAGSTTQE